MLRVVLTQFSLKPFSSNILPLLHLLCNKLKIAMNVNVPSISMKQIALRVHYLK